MGTLLWLLRRRALEGNGSYVWPAIGLPALLWSLRRFMLNRLHFFSLVVRISYHRCVAQMSLRVSCMIDTSFVLVNYAAGGQAEAEERDLNFARMTFTVHDRHRKGCSKFRHTFQDVC